MCFLRTEDLLPRRHKIQVEKIRMKYFASICEVYLKILMVKSTINFISLECIYAICTMSNDLYLFLSRSFAQTCQFE